MREYVKHYLSEGVDCLFLIDNHSTDNYLDHNKDWMDILIQKGKVKILKSYGGQVEDYNSYLEIIKKYEWVISCDMDEFFFGVSPESTLKSILSENSNDYDYFLIPWKLFKHLEKFQPKSVIENNTYTHDTPFDGSSPSMGYKYIIKTEKIERMDIHRCFVKADTRKLQLKNCHNDLIQNNHYRTQSEEFLRGVKEIRGGGVSPKKYMDYDKHETYEYNRECLILKNKRRLIINEMLENPQVRPSIYNKSSFHQ
jgi:hypothetical protein